MIELRVETHNAFTVCGKKTWISGQDNDLFGCFWEECHADGTVNLLRTTAKPEITNSSVIGISCVEKDPSNRAFDFYVAAEGAQVPGFDTLVIPTCTWAIFKNRGEQPLALVEAEMHAFNEWLPQSGYVHAPAPELEVYPYDGSVEFWLPVVAEK